MRLFISYTQQDLGLVRQLVEHLREAGHEFSAGGMVPLRDDTWQDQLRDVIHDSDAFVYAITPNSMGSEWCRWEYITAVEEGIPLIPVMLEATTLDMYLDEYPYADFTDGFDDKRLINAFITNLDRIMVDVKPDTLPEKITPASKPTRFATELTNDLLEYTELVAPSRQDKHGEAKGGDIPEDEAAPMAPLPPDPRRSAPAPDMKTHIAPSTFQSELKKRTSTRRKRMLMVGGVIGAFILAVSAIVAAATFALPIITFDPAEALVEANTLFQSGEMQTAVDLYNRVLEREPRNVEAYLNRAAANIGLGNVDAALTDFQRLLRIDENFILAYNNRANLYAAQGEYLLALDDYNQAISIEPENALLYYNRGNVYRELGANRQAIVNYNRSIQLNPNNPLVYLNRGVAYGNLEEVENAIESFTQAIDINAELAEAYALRGYARQISGQREAALADYRQHIELAGDDALPVAVEGIERLTQAE